ncbi:MAG: RNA methyltransferase [Gemmatimonadaceae bacterium]|nr:RNA methyltransferase [Gemmatimonadaceae bacterium]
MPESLLHRVRVVLYEPQNPINIAATVRAMKNFGVRDLTLVRPVPYTPYRLEGIAHDTLDVIERIRDVDSLDEALSDAVLVAAFSARRRRVKWELATPRSLAPMVLSQAVQGTVVLMFGREDDGLPNEALDRAHVAITIPTSEHASLNLAQAVVIALYELHVAAGDATRIVEPHRHLVPPATSADLERLYRDQERALEAVEFFKTRFRTHIMRSARSMTSRTRLDAREVMLARAMWIEVVRAMNRYRGIAGLPPIDPGEPVAFDAGDDFVSTDDPSPTSTPHGNL